MQRIIAPKLDLQTVEVEVVLWHKREGDRVVKGEPLLEIATEKATLDIEAPESGVLQGIACREGERVRVGQTMAFIAAEGERIAPSAREVAEKLPNAPASATPGITTAAPAQAPGAGIRSTPAARQLCRQHSVSVEEVYRAIGKEPVGEKDVQRFLALRTQLSVAEVTPVGSSATQAGSDSPFEVVPLSSRRKAIARRMTESMQKIPHIHLFGEVNVERLERRKTELATAGNRVTLTDLLIKIVGELLAEMPMLNATFVDGGAEPAVHRHRVVNLGLAVSTDQGIVAPVLKDVARKSLAQLVREKEDLVTRARANRLSPQDSQGATFTLTNLGMFGVSAFTAIINPPEVAILSIGAFRERISLAGGKAVTVREVGVCLGLDHRVLDGADGGRFLARFREKVEDPPIFTLET